MLTNLGSLICDLSVLMDTFFFCLLNFQISSLKSITGSKKKDGDNILNSFHPVINRHTQG